MEAEVMERAVFNQVYGSRPQEETPAEKAKAIARYVFERLGVCPACMSRKTHSASVADAKRIAITLISERFDFRLWQLSEIFGGLNHATIIYHRRMHQNLLFSDKEYRELTDRIREELRTK